MLKTAEVTDRYFKRRFNAWISHSFYKNKEPKPATLPQLGGRLEVIVEKIKALKKKRGEINDYYSWAKNSLKGYSILFGEEALKTLGKPMAEWNEAIDGWTECYRKDYFENIKYRSKLRKIRDRMKILDEEYNICLGQIKAIAPMKNRAFSKTS